MGCLECGPECGGVDLIKASFDIKEEGGDLEPGSLEGSCFVCEGEAGVRGAQS